MTEPILAQIERFAPGFRERILAVSTISPAELEAYNPNYVGGDIAGGRFDLGQLFTRPSLRLFDPYATPDPGIFLCSAADAAGRWRPRHGRLARRPVRASETRVALSRPGLLAAPR